MNADEIKTTKKLLLVLGIPGAIIIAAFVGFLLGFLNCRNLSGLSQGLCELVLFVPAIYIGLFLVIFIISLICNLPKKNQIIGKYTMDKKTFLRVLGRSFLWATSIFVLAFCVLIISTKGEPSAKFVALFVALAMITIMSFLTVHNKKRK